MSLSTPFIRRPVATTLLTLGVLAAGAVAFFQLPVSPLPKVDYPTISVRAQLPERARPWWRRASPHRSSAISGRLPTSPK